VDKIGLTAVSVLAFVSLGAAQPISTSDVSPGNGFERSLSGGEGFKFSAAVENELNQEVPVGAEIVVESGVNMSEGGTEFAPTGEISSGEEDFSLGSRYSKQCRAGARRRGRLEHQCHDEPAHRTWAVQL
jgi:hypothetical protein